MIEYILILFFAISPLDEEPRYYEIYHFLGQDQTCMLLDKDISLYNVVSDSFQVESQCIKFINSLPEKPKRRVYDQYGKYYGTLEKSGKYYDKYGKFKGSIDKNGRVFDPYGKYEGSIYDKLFK
tara:strand:+ start:128 stop:499 length:372 start_codon:yes stop_codon:yes gene_type:complete